MDATSSTAETPNVNSPDKDKASQDARKQTAGEGVPTESNSTTGSFECNICLDTAKDAVVSMCGHLFCWPCLHCWLETAEARLVCPVCKAAISRDKVRIKYRYLVCFVSVRAPNPTDQFSGYPGCQLNDPVAMRLSESNLVSNLRRHVQFAHGSLGAGQLMARFRVIHWCPASGLLVVRCLRDSAAKIQAALAFISEIETSGQKRSALIDVYHMSGTVRGCQKFLVNFYARQLYSKPNPEYRTALAWSVADHLIDPNPPLLLEDQSC